MLLKRLLLKSLISWNHESLWDGEAPYLSHPVNFFVWSFSNQHTQAVANQSSFYAHCSRLISYIKILLEHSETPHVDFRASFYFVLNSKRSSLATQEISLSLTQRQFHWYHLRKKKKKRQFHFSVGCSNFIQVQAKEDTATKSCQAIFCFKILDTVLILLCISDRGFTSISGFTISLKIMWPFPWHNVLQTSLQLGWHAAMTLEDCCVMEQVQVSIKLQHLLMESLSLKKTGTLMFFQGNRSEDVRAGIFFNLMQTSTATMENSVEIP